MKSWLIVAVVLMTAALGFASDQYHSLCAKPRFSPDEKSLAFWDSETIGESEHKNTLKILNIESNQTTVVAERIFNEGNILGAHYAEDPGDYENLDWSPDSRYLAFALNLRDVEIFDTQAEKVVAALDLCGQACAGIKTGWIQEKDSLYFKARALCNGYFHIEWLNDHSILVGYTSELSPHTWTDDTYGMIEKINGSFRIRQAVLPADAPIYKTYSANEGKNFILVVDTAPTGELLGVRRKMYDGERTIEWMLAARENSPEKNVLALSRTAAVAVIASNSDPSGDDNPYNNKISTEMIRIPEAFRPLFLKMRKENR